MSNTNQVKIYCQLWGCNEIHDAPGLCPKIESHLALQRKLDHLRMCEFLAINPYPSKKETIDNLTKLYRSL